MGRIFKLEKKPVLAIYFDLKAQKAGVPLGYFNILMNTVLHVYTQNLKFNFEYVCMLFRIEMLFGLIPYYTTYAYCQLES